MVSYIFVRQYSQLVTPMNELDNQGAWFISATSAVDPICLLNVWRREGDCQLSCVIQSINIFLHTRFVRHLCSIWNAEKFQIVFSQDSSKRSTSSFKTFTSSASILYLSNALDCSRTTLSIACSFLHTLSMISWLLGPGFLSTPLRVRRERRVRAANRVNMAWSFCCLACFAAFVARFCNICIKVDTKRPIDVL